MAWQDRPYYRESGDAQGGLMWLLTGSVQLFSFKGIRVRAHASLIIFIVLGVLIGVTGELSWQDRLLSMWMLFAMVLLHEFGHAFTARWVGGEADEIVMHPLGGLALAQPPRRPLPTFLTIAGGPAVNAIICGICLAVMWGIGRTSGWYLDWNPGGSFHYWLDIWRWAFWIYQMSLMLLLFNLLPIFPLDGGQMLQTMLWPIVGYYKSMQFSAVAGMVGAVLGSMYALARGNWMLLAVCVMGFIYCIQIRRMLAAMGPFDMPDETDLSAAYEVVPEKKPSRRARNRALKAARRARQEQRRLDAILAKVSKQGMQSLTWMERRALRKATEKQRKADAKMR